MLDEKLLDILIKVQTYINKTHLTQTFPFQLSFMFVEKNFP
jgi:hypothetical protein